MKVFRNQKMTDMKLRFFTFQVRMKKIVLTLGGSLLISLTATAQLDNTVEVTNEMRPVATDAKKVEVKTQPVEVKAKHYSMQYATEEPTLKAYAAESLGDYETEEVWKGRKKGYVHLAGGSHGNVDGQAAYQFDLTEQDALTANLGLKGFYGKTKENSYFGLENWKSRDYRNWAALKYRHRMENGVEVFAKGNYENRLFNYMDTEGIATDKQHNVLAGARVGITPWQIGRLTFDAEAGIDFFNQERATMMEKKLGETVLRLNGQANYQIADKHSAGLGLGVYGSSYSGKELKGVTNLRVTPHYLYSSDPLEVQLGLFVSTEGNVAPDVALTYHATEKSDAYVAARGYEVDNDFRRLTGINPYFGLFVPADMTKLKMVPSFHQIDVCVGYRFKEFHGFSGNVNFGFDKTKKEANIYWTADIVNGLEYPLIELTPDKNFYINADFTYAYEDVVKVDARNTLNFKSSKEDGSWLEDSYTVPSYAMDWKVDFKVLKGLHVGLDMLLECYTRPEMEEDFAYKRPNTMNVGASVRYSLPIDLPLTVFVKGDNLLDKRQDRYLSYRSIGANFLAGFSMSF